MQSKAPLLTVKDVAQRINVSVRQAQRLVHEMSPLRVGAGDKHMLLRVRPEALEAWLLKRSAVPKEPETGKPELTIIRPKKRRRPYGMYPAPVNGKIPMRRAGGKAK